MARLVLLLTSLLAAAPGPTQPAQGPSLASARSLGEALLSGKSVTFDFEDGKVSALFDKEELRFNSVEELIEQVGRAKTEIIWRTGEGRAAWSPLRLSAMGRVLHDTARRVRKTSQEPGHAVLVARVVPLSFVGPYLSFGRSECEQAAGGPMGCWQEWSAVDVRTGKPASILDLVDEAPLLEALKRDPYLVDKLSTETLAAAKSLDDLESAMKSRGSADRPAIRHAFSVLAWSPKKGSASIRIGVTEFIGSGNFMVSQLGLEVPVKPEVRPHLDAALRGQGFFQGKYRWEEPR